MSKFIDFHQKLPPMPAEAVEMMRANLKAGKADKFGVKAVNLYTGKGGEAFCMTEAPNAEAVIKSHQAQGITQTREHVVEVNSLV